MASFSGVVVGLFTVAASLWAAYEFGEDDKEGLIAALQEDLSEQTAEAREAASELADARELIAELESGVSPPNPPAAPVPPPDAGGSSEDSASGPAPERDARLDLVASQCWDMDNWSDGGWATRDLCWQGGDENDPVVLRSQSGLAVIDSGVPTYEVCRDATHYTKEPQQVADAGHLCIRTTDGRLAMASLLERSHQPGRSPILSFDISVWTPT